MNAGTDLCFWTENAENSWHDKRCRLLRVLSRWLSSGRNNHLRRTQQTLTDTHFPGLSRKHVADQVSCVLFNKWNRISKRILFVVTDIFSTFLISVWMNNQYVGHRDLCVWPVTHCAEPEPSVWDQKTEGWGGTRRTTGCAHAVRPWSRSWSTRASSWTATRTPETCAPPTTSSLICE